MTENKDYFKQYIWLHTIHSYYIDLHYCTFDFNVYTVSWVLEAIDVKLLWYYHNISWIHKWILFHFWRSHHISIDYIYVLYKCNFSSLRWYINWNSIFHFTNVVDQRIFFKNWQFLIFIFFLSFLFSELNCTRTSDQWIACTILFLYGRTIYNVEAEVFAP